MNPSFVLAVCLGVYICIAEISAGVSSPPAMMWPPRPGDESQLTQTQLLANSYNNPPPGRRSVSRSIFKASKTKRGLTVYPPRPGDQSIRAGETESQDHDTGSAASNRLTGALQGQVKEANSWYSGPIPGRRSLTRRNFLKRSYGQTMEQD